MSLISPRHAKWAIVDRLCLMLEESRQQEFGVTHTYALFTAILCWVMQHIRDKKDKRAYELFEELDGLGADTVHWLALNKPNRHIRRISNWIEIPETKNFEDRSAGRFLINLRNAVAHGNARTVSPFNTETHLLGFTFTCTEHYRNGEVKWEGEITLLEDDMREIGIALATRYCDALAAGQKDFPRHARSLSEQLT